MVSMLRRRSGVAVTLITDLLDWEPHTIIQVGIGDIFDEIQVFKDAWPEAKLIGFEPHPEILPNVKKTYYGEVREMAIGAEPGKARLHTKKRHKGGSSLFPFPKEFETHSYEVRVDTLDNQFPNGAPDNKTLLWLDCEGSELAALQGGRNLLRNVEVINVEMTGKPVNEGCPSQLKLHEYIMDCGFKRQWVHTQRSSAGQNDAIYVRPYLFCPEFCCCPCQLKK